MPLSSISDVSFDELVTDSQQPSYGLVMQLMGETATNCMINANEYAKNHVALAFASKKDVNTLRRLLEPTKARTDRNPLPSQSEAINVSEDNGPTASDSALIYKQSLVRTTFPGSASIVQRDPVTSINPAMLHRAHTSHHASADNQEKSIDSKVEQDGNISNVRHYIEMAEEIDVSESDGWVNKAIESIDVSQAYGLRREDTRDGSEFRRAILPMDRMQENSGGFDRSSDTGLSSSSRRHKGLKAIQNAPEIGAQQSILSVQPVENRHRSEAEDGGFDELYDASPKMNYGRRPSPRTVAQESAPSNAERTPGPTTRQPNVATEPSTKLSRQLRNYNGVVEPHTDQCADTGLTTVTEDAAGDVKAKANSKKKKVPIPVKANTLVLDSEKPTTMVKPKLKPIATAESSNAATDNCKIPPSPTRASSHVQNTGDKKDAVTAQPKPTKVPPKRQEQHKPVPTKDIPTTSSKGPVSRLKKAIKDKTEAKNPNQKRVPRTQNGKTVTYDDDDDTIWDVDLAYSEGKPQTSPEKHRPPKTEAKTTRTAKTRKGKGQNKVLSDKAKADKVAKTRTQASTARVVKAKPRPAALSQPRSRRTAAIKANQRIQGLVESDEIEDDEDIVAADTRSRQPAPSGITKAPRDQKTQNGRDDRPSSGGELPNADSLGKDFVLDNVSPKSSDKQKLISVSATKTDSSPEKVDLVRNVAIEFPIANPSPVENISQKENTTGTLMIPLLSGHGDRSKQENLIIDEQNFEVAEARAKPVPVNALRLQNSIAKTQSAPTHPPKESKTNQGYDDQNQDQAVIQRAKIVFEREKVEGYVTPLHAPSARMVVDIRQRRDVPQLAEAAQKSLSESTGRTHDPFGTKLNALLLEPKCSNSKIQRDEVVRNSNVVGKGLDTPKPAGLVSSLTDSKTKASEKPQRYLKSLMQVDGKGDDSSYRSSKPAVESISASRGEIKRKGEQEEDTRPKRVKVAPQESLDRALEEPMKNANTAKKTPLPVTNNRPSVIGFSASGPRNQGIILTQKKKPLQEFGIEWGTHDTTSNTQAEEGFAPVREALQVSPEEVRNNLETLSGALKKVRSSPRRGETEHLKTLEAVRLPTSDTQENQSQKRKFAPFLDETAPREHEQNSKRPKRGEATPPSANTHHPKMLPDLSPGMAHDRSQRLSSQTTRVNENGSPMPFLINPSENIADEEQYPDEDDGKEALAEAQLEDQFVSQDYDTVLPEPVPPRRSILSTMPTLQPKTMTSQSISSNSKHIPSSPHAASVFGTMPKHHIYHDGEIVNPETKESIIPIKPQDPFLGATRNPQNQFMEALRRSSELASERLTSEANDKRRSGALSVRQTLDVGKDPDKTLVESERRKSRQNYVSNSSSNSQSDTSTQVSQPDESSEDEKDGDADAKWRKALEPHQGNMLESLLAISHVSTSI